MTDREALAVMFRSTPYRAWAAGNPVEHRKVQDEYAGRRRPSAVSAFARSLIAVARNHPPSAPPPPPVVTPPVARCPAPFDRPGALWRASDSEDIPRAVRAGLGWALLQQDGDDWTVISTRCDREGIPWGLWFHCLSIENVRALLVASRSMRLPIVGLNVEEELRTTLTPDVLAAEVAAVGYTGTVALIAYGWIQNDVDLRPVRDWTIMLEMFPADAPKLAPPRVKIHDCIAHARAQGGRYLHQLMQAYHGMRPGAFDRDVLPSSVYPAEDINDQWEEWLA